MVAPRAVLRTAPAKAYDIAIIGGGIIGVATAREFLKRFPGISLALFEKEPRLATHQTGRNSGVIHCGIYYTPGSMKAKLCVEGAAMMYGFAEGAGIETRRCGKLIVASNEAEAQRIQALYERGVANRVPGKQGWRRRVGSSCC